MRRSLAEEYQNALRGDLTRVPAVLDATAGAREAPARAYRAALSAALDLVTGTAPAEPDELSDLALADSSTRTIALHACWDRALHALLRLDTAELARVAAIETSFGAAEPTAGLLLDVLRGGRARVASVAPAVARAAAAAEHPVAQLDATCIEALARLDAGELDVATATARRASRMARSEGILQREYFANLVLARVRRRAGKPHAAARIQQALGRVVPPPWHAWLSWERTLCGRPLEGEPPTARPHSAGETDRDWSEPLSSMFDAASHGDRDAFVATRVDAEARVAEWAALRDEASEVAVAVDPHADVAAVADGELRAWLTGRSITAPPTVRGLNVSDIDERGDETAAVYVVGGLPRGGRRVLRHGMALLGAGAAPLPFALKQARTFTALAALTLAGAEGLSDEALFQAAYGFAYVPTKHSGTLRTLVYRLRAESAAVATLERSLGRCALQPHALMWFPDPRCAPDLDEMILRVLATRGDRVSVRDLAASLSVPLRTVQRAVSGLVDTGACEAVQHGRNTFYRMEDTTFSEPTLTRLRPRLAE